MRGQHADYAPTLVCINSAHLCVKPHVPPAGVQKALSSICQIAGVDPGGGDNVSRLIVPVGERHPNHSPSSGSAHLLKF